MKTMIGSQKFFAALIVILGMGGLFGFQNCAPTRFESLDFSSEALPPPEEPRQQSNRCESSNLNCETDRFIGSQTCTDTANGPQYGVCQIVRCKDPFQFSNGSCVQPAECGPSGSTLTCSAQGEAGVRVCENSMWSNCFFIKAVIGQVGFVPGQNVELRPQIAYFLELESNLPSSAFSTTSSFQTNLRYLSGECSLKQDQANWKPSLLNPANLKVGVHNFTLSASETNQLGGCRFNYEITGPRGLLTRLTLQFARAQVTNPGMICTPGTKTATGCESFRPTNGSSERNCQSDGMSYGSCQSTCNSGFTAQGTQPQITCVAQVCAPGTMTAVGCESFRPVNGKSERQCNAAGTGYGTCFSSCNTNFQPMGAQPSITCQASQCSNGAINPPSQGGTCNQCNTATHYWNGSACVAHVCAPNSKDRTQCQQPTTGFGFSERTCSTQGSAWGSCVTSCNTGYVPTGSGATLKCEPSSCSNSATNPPQCNTCSSSMFWDVASSSCKVQVCAPNSKDTSGCVQPANGKSERTCNSTGSVYGSCVLSCNNGFVLSGGQCLATSCSNGAINPPSQGGTCNQCNTSTHYWDAASSSCKVRVCAPNSKDATGCTPQPANGNSERTCNSTGSGYGSCVQSCNNGFVLSGGQCLATSCTNGATNAPQCNQCNTSTHFWDVASSSCKVQVCAPNSKDTSGCVQPANGKSERTCNSTGSVYGSCVLSCNNGFVLSGGQCLATSCSNGAINPPSQGGTCNQCNTSTHYWDAASSSCKVRVCAPTVVSLECPVMANAAGSKICRADGSGFGTCSYTCNLGFTMVNGQCLANSCSNGATNPPSQGGACNQCPTGKVLLSGQCIDRCSNGAANPPECTSCPAGTLYDGAKNCVRCNALVQGAHVRPWYDPNVRRSVRYDTGIDIMGDSPETTMRICREQYGEDALAFGSTQRNYSSPGDNRVAKFSGGQWTHHGAVLEDPTVPPNCYPDESGTMICTPAYQVFPYVNNLYCSCGTVLQPPIEDPCDPRYSDNPREIRICQ